MKPDRLREGGELSPFETSTGLVFHFFLILSVTFSLLAPNPMNPNNGAPMKKLSSILFAAMLLGTAVASSAMTCDCASCECGDDCDC